MGVVDTALRLLLPRGIAWALRGDGDKLLRGVAKSLERVRAVTDSLVADSRPGSASETTLREWHAALGQRYDPTRPVSVQRARLEAFRSSAGGATKALLEQQLQLEYPAVSVAEITASGECGLDEAGVAYCGGTDADYSPLYYDIVGTVDTDEDALRVGDIISRFAPLHLIGSTDLLTILSLSETAECGLGISGLEECGHDGS